MTRLARLGWGIVALAAACGAETDEDPAAIGPAFIPPGPLATDIWLADLHWETSGPPAVGEPTNITQRPGYDNQPFFVPDGSGFWYTAVDQHDGQADIWRYDLGSGTVARVTASNRGLNSGSPFACRPGPSSRCLTSNRDPVSV